VLLNADADLIALGDVCAGQRLLCQCCFRGADDEDGNRSGLWSLQREEERWNGLHHGDK
jgi:hypothetical protein